MNSFDFALPDATIVHLEATEIDPTQHQIRLTVRTFGVSCSCPGCRRSGAASSDCLTPRP